MDDDGWASAAGPHERAVPGQFERLKPPAVRREHVNARMAVGEQGLREGQLRRHPHVFGEESLKYLPEEYVRHLKEKAAQIAPDARQDACGHGQDKAPGQNPESRREAQRGSSALLADWKEIKSYEKSGREWEEEYLFQAFDEAEELISIARKRKLEKKS